MSNLDRSRLILVDQMMFEELIPRRGHRHPYMDHELIESRLRQLDEIAPLLMGLARGAAMAGRGAMAVGRGVATVGSKAAQAGRAAGQATVRAGQKGVELGRKGVELAKQGVEKGREVGGKVKQGYEKVKEIKGKFDQAKAAGDAEERAAGQEPKSLLDKMRAKAADAMKGSGDGLDAEAPSGPPPGTMAQPPKEPGVSPAALGGAALGGAALGGAAAKATTDQPKPPPAPSGPPLSRKGPDDAKPQDTPTSSPTPPPQAAPTEPVGQERDTEGPGIKTGVAGAAAAGLAGAAAGAAMARPDAPDQPEAPEAPAEEPTPTSRFVRKPRPAAGGGAGQGPRGAHNTPMGGSCPPGRTKTSVDGAPEGSKRCNDQTANRKH